MNKLINTIDLVANKYVDRKYDNKIPYINHLIEIINTLSNAGVTDENILISSLLIDITENTNITYDDLLLLYGTKIVNIVRELHVDKKLTKLDTSRKLINDSVVLTNSAKIIRLAKMIVDLNNLLNSPPVRSNKKILGYVVWCYSMFANLKNINNNLDKQLYIIFSKYNLHSFTQNDITKLLNGYYYNIEFDYE